MKLIINHNKQFITIGALLVGIVALCAWSPPGTENILTNRANLILRDTNDSTYQYNITPGSHSNLMAGKGNSAGISGQPQIAKSSVICGSWNQCGGENNLVVGNENSVRGDALSGSAWHSAAIGLFNHVYTTCGWVIGSHSEVTGYKGVSIGTGTISSVPSATALGRYNAPMTSNAVLDVGSGTSEARFTALRVTDDGAVVLGRAQGDISMGSYQ